MPNEKAMEAAVVRWLRRRFDEGKVARQVHLGKKQVDVVAYDKRRGVFKVLECKPTSRQTGIAQAFGQIAGYQNEISRRPDDFVDSASEKTKIQMRFARWMEATDTGRRIRVEFYVVLADKACNEVSWLRDLKSQQFSQVGIVRYKKNGTCKEYIHDESRKRNYELTRAAVLTIPLHGRWPAPVAERST